VTSLTNSWEGRVYFSIYSFSKLTVTGELDGVGLVLTGSCLVSKSSRQEEGFTNGLSVLGFNSLGWTKGLLAGYLFTSVDLLIAS